MISEERRDYYAGALVALIGAGTLKIGYGYNVGTLTKMGPGYFPCALGAMLIFMGALIALAARASSKEPVVAKEIEMPGHGAFPAHPDWRGWGCILGSVVIFIVMAEFAGLLAATFLCVFVACWGDKTANLKSSALLATGITVFGVGLFHYVLHVQIPIIRGL